MVTRLQGPRRAPQLGRPAGEQMELLLFPVCRRLVEVHAQRLGQTGEHTQMARRFVSRRVLKTIGGFTFLVPAPEERVLVATLQRMYRHFYFRVCDIVNTSCPAGRRRTWISPNCGGPPRWAASGPGVCHLSEDRLRLRKDSIVASARTAAGWFLQAAPFGGEVVYVGAGSSASP